MAWVIAKMWASVKVPENGDPLWPLVPNFTIWLGSNRSGRRSKYSRSSRATSIRISLGAGLPASGEMLAPTLARGGASRILGTVLLPKSHLHTPQWCGRWRTFPILRHSRSLFAPRHLSPHTDRQAALVPVHMR